MNQCLEVYLVLNSRNDPIQYEALCLQHVCSTFRLLGSLGKDLVRLDLPGKQTRLDQDDLVFPLKDHPVERESLHPRRGTHQTIDWCMRRLWGYTLRLIRMSPLRLWWCLQRVPTVICLSPSISDSSASHELYPGVPCLHILVK